MKLKKVKNVGFECYTNFRPKAKVQILPLIGIAVALVLTGLVLDTLWLIIKYYYTI